MKKISLVVPAYNEEQTMQPFYAQLMQTLATLPTYAWEIVFVNDGSRDRTWQLITALAAQDARVVGVNFSRNFGSNMRVVMR
jgi:glycosyltransferase involved in cell wall biosynthesis